MHWRYCSIALSSHYLIFCHGSNHWKMVFILKVAQVAELPVGCLYVALSLYTVLLVWNKQLPVLVYKPPYYPQSLTHDDVMTWKHFPHYWPQIASFMGTTWGPPGSCRPQVVPSSPWTLLSGALCVVNILVTGGSPSQRVIQIFDSFFVVSMDKLWNRQSSGWSYDITPIQWMFSCHTTVSKYLTFPIAL